MNRPNDAYWLINIPIEPEGEYAITKEEKEMFKDYCLKKQGTKHNRIAANLIKNYIKENIKNDN